MNSKSGNVNSATLRTKLILMKKRNQKLKLPIILLRQLLKFKTRNMKVLKKSVWFSVLINLDPCASRLRFKEKLISKEIRKIN